MNELDQYLADRCREVMETLAWQETRRRAMLLEKKIMVFAMSGAFLNELSLTYTSNGMAYDVRIT